MYLALILISSLVVVVVVVFVCRSNVKLIIPIVTCVYGQCASNVSDARVLSSSSSVIGPSLAAQELFGGHLLRELSSPFVRGSKSLRRLLCHRCLLLISIARPTSKGSRFPCFRCVIVEVTYPQQAKTWSPG